MAEVKVTPLEKDRFDTYIEVGKKSYFQHYLDFWADGNPVPYINESFTKEVLQEELKSTNSELFLIYSDKIPVGILKVIPNKSLRDYSAEDAFLLQKIYLLEESSGKGVGTQVLNFVESLAKKKGKKIIWLDAMVKGKATPFYLKNGYTIHSTRQIQYPNFKNEKREMYVMVKKL